MLTKRITKGTYVGTNEEFIIVDDYADPNCAHRVLANAWIGTTLIHEELDDKEGEDPAERDELEIASPHFVKSLFSLSERREPDCGTPRRRLQKTASPHHLGEETGRINGSGKQASGVSRSETLASPRAWGRLYSIRPARARTIPDRPCCFFDRGPCTSSLPRLTVVVEGEYKAGTHDRGKEGISDMSIRTKTLGRMDYAVGRRPTQGHALSQMSAGIWLKLQVKTRSAKEVSRRSLGSRC